MVTAEKADSSRQTQFRDRVLIVEDDADARRSLETLVATWGFETASAADGASALTIAGQFTPHYILIDIELPDMKGYELAESLRAAYGERFKLIALTGHEVSGIQAEAFNSGFDVYLSKPVNVARLKASLQGHGF